MASSCSRLGDLFAIAPLSAHVDPPPATVTRRPVARKRTPAEALPVDVTPAAKRAPAPPPPTVTDEAIGADFREVNKQLGAVPDFSACPPPTFPAPFKGDIFEEVTFANFPAAVPPGVKIDFGGLEKELHDVVATVAHAGLGDLDETDVTVLMSRFVVLRSSRVEEIISSVLHSEDDVSVLVRAHAHAELLACGHRLADGLNFGHVISAAHLYSAMDPAHQPPERREMVWGKMRDLNRLLEAGTKEFCAQPGAAVAVC